MAYQKTVWKDQDVENPRTYVERDNGDGTITLLDAFGTVTELGTPVNAANMNKIENGIADTEALANTKSDDNTVVHKTGDEVIGGIKTLYSQDGINLRLKSNYIDDDYTPSTTQFSNFIDNVDINNKLLSRIYTTKYPNGANGIALQAWKGSTNYVLGVFNDGTTYAPPSDFNDSIVTTVAKSKAESGYFKLGNGLIIQWGAIVASDTNVKTISFSTPFTIIPSIAFSYVRTNDSRYDTTANCFDMLAYKATVSGFKYQNRNIGTDANVKWIAIGY